MIIFYIGPILFLNSLFTFLPTFYAQYASFSKELADFAKKKFQPWLILLLFLVLILDYFLKEKIFLLK